MSFLWYPKIIPYTNVEHFGIFHFWVMLWTSKQTNKQTDRQTDSNILPTPTDSVGVGNKDFEEKWQSILRVARNLRQAYAMQNFNSTTYAEQRRQQLLINVSNCSLQPTCNVSHEQLTPYTKLRLYYTPTESVLGIALYTLRAQHVQFVAVCSAIDCYKIAPAYSVRSLNSMDRSGPSNTLTTTAW